MSPNKMPASYVEHAAATTGAGVLALGRLPKLKTLAAFGTTGAGIRYYRGKHYEKGLEKVKWDSLQDMHFHKAK